MTRDVDVRVDYHPEAMGRIARSREVREWLHRHMAVVASGLARDAPIRTGAARRSIKADVVMGASGWFGTASWDVEHYYIGILNSRTHWAEPDVLRLRYV